MAIWAFPFPSVNGDRAYSNTDFIQFYANIFSTGIIPTIPIPGATAFQVTETETPSLYVNVGIGAAIIGGGQVMNTAVKQFQIQAPLTSQSRTDSFVIQWNNSTRGGDIVYKPNSTQVIQTADIWELQLATIVVPANAAIISQSNITDTRADSTVCGYSTPFESLKTGDLLAQFKSDLEANEQLFAEWFENVKDQLDDDAAGHLQNEIDDLDARKANDNEVVHNTGDESISGEKTFTDNVSVKNITVAGDVPKTEITTFWANFKEYTTGIYPTYSVKNGRVVLQGAVTPKSNQAGGPATNYGVFYLPSEIVPLQDITILSQGSGYNQFCAIAGKDGVLRVGRYTTNGADVTMQAGNWLPFSFTYDL